MRKICVVTGSRAEYGLLYLLMKGIQEDPDLELQLIVTGMHLSPEFGSTYRVIEEDGFSIDAKVETLLSSDTPVGIGKSIGLGIIGCAEALKRLCPDILILYGDRFEILAAAQAALVLQIPIAHVGGGDTTEGAFDEAIRHSITKMSHLHFVTNEVAAQRVRQLGEAPELVYQVGGIGLDQIRRLRLLGRSELEQALGFEFKQLNLLVTFHPVTLDQQSSTVQFHELLIALDSFGPKTGIIFTKPNADTGGKALIQMMDEFVATRPNAKAFTSLGQLRYLSTLSHVDAIVGNSSSGLYEMPSFKKPTINIGNRQKGRLQAESVFNCNPVADEISRAINSSLTMDLSSVANPYGDGNSTPRIIAVLKTVSNPKQLLMKHFHGVTV
ncbi:MAG TPA: UDP-N-acetylglucosamine 2-epimerase [Desulfuromonadaceae bacterium]|jgi:UDP-N-acetylglucosamine 2-epimerase (non-hydrolysing)/GDP/UDP-N,N'-diacetylbacillosamine 2-epimerase (hydrolysing)